MHFSLRNQLQDVFQSYGTEEVAPVVAEIESGFKQVFEGTPKEEGGTPTEQVVEKGCGPGGKKKPMEHEESDDDEDDKKKMQKQEPRFAILALDHHSAPLGSTPVKKFNPYHAADGRFTTAQGGTGDKPTPTSNHLTDPKIKPVANPDKPAVSDKRVLDDLKTAFSDGPERNLNFLSEKDMDVSEWVEAMDKATPGGYNEFNARRVGKVLAKYPGITVRPAREYSVAAYVSGPEKVLAQMATDLKRNKTLRADEVNVFGPGHKLRDPTNYDPNKGFDSMPIKHTFTKPVLRLWWD